MDGDFSITIDDVRFRIALEEYMALTGKAVEVVLREQARLLAERLMKLTVPTKASDGRRRVEIDIKKVYLRNDWWESLFQFTNQKLGERIKDLVRGQNQADLEAIFERSTRLNRIRIEPFEKSRHESARRDGRVNYPAPFSYPLSDQKQIKEYIARKKKAVGTAKGGWGACVAALGGKAPAWASKGGLGSVTDKSDGEDAFITLTNKVDYFASLDGRKGIVSKGLEGRERDMARSAENQLRRAAHEAKLA